MKPVFALIISLSLLFTACLNEPDPVEKEELSSVSKVSDSGALINRYEDNVSFTFFDLEAGWRIFIGLDVPGVCENNIAYDQFSVTDIFLPEREDVRRIIELIKGSDLTVYVFPYPGVNVCEYLAQGNIPLSGTARLIYTDNDLFTFQHDYSNANTYGTKVTGKVYGPDGTMYLLNITYRVTWKDDPDFYRENVFIQLVEAGN